MRRYYLRQNIAILAVSLIFAFVYITMIDWAYRGQRLENVLYLVTGYMTRLSSLIGIAGIFVCERYFHFIKDQWEGEFVYVLPISRSSLWKCQWIASVGMMIGSWIMALLILYITSISYLKEIKAGWMILSIIAYILADIGAVTLFMWMQTRVKNSRRASAIFVGMIGITVIFFE